MKCTLWNIFRNMVCLFLVVALGSYLEYLYSIETRWVSLVLILVYMGFSYYHMSRKTPIVLSEEEQTQTIPERQSFHHKQNIPYWIDIVITIPFAWLLIFAYAGLYQILNGVSFANMVIRLWQALLVMFQSVTLWLVMSGIGVLSIFSYRRQARNQYIIEGDTLIIQEHRLFKTEEELRIPLETIDEVYTKFNNTAYYGLYLLVQGVTRRLNTGENSIALGKAILQHKQALSSRK